MKTKQCPLCGRKTHSGPCGSQELMLPLPGGELSPWDIEEMPETEVETTNLKGGINAK